MIVSVCHAGMLADNPTPVGSVRKIVQFTIDSKLHYFYVIMILVTVGKAGNRDEQAMLSFVAYPLSSIFYEPEQCFTALCIRKGAASFSSQMKHTLVGEA